MKIYRTRLGVEPASRNQLGHPEVLLQKTGKMTNPQEILPISSFAKFQLSLKSLF
jgi:hypothetical protein